MMITTIVLGAFVLGTAAAMQTGQQQPWKDEIDLDLKMDGAGSGPVPVPIVLGVMSRCPDAFLCEDVFDKVLDHTGHVKVDLSLLYVAKLDESEPTGVNCKHGPLECIGNIHQLCLAKYAKESSVWWPFIQCSNYQGRATIGTENAARHCAQVAGIDWVESGVAECVAGEEGPRLLRESVVRGQGLGIVKSCTIIINEKVRCVHDDEWKECDEGHTVPQFVASINSEYEKLNAQ